MNRKSSIVITLFEAQVFKGERERRKEGYKYVFKLNNTSKISG